MLITIPNFRFEAINNEIFIYSKKINAINQTRHFINIEMLQK